MILWGGNLSKATSGISSPNRIDSWIYNAQTDPPAHPVCDCFMLGQGKPKESHQKKTNAHGSWNFELAENPPGAAANVLHPPRKTASCFRLAGAGRVLQQVAVSWDREIRFSVASREISEASLNGPLKLCPGSPAKGFLGCTDVRKVTGVTW